MTLNGRLVALLGRAGTSLCDAQSSVDARRDPDTACAIVDAWEQVKQALELLRAEAEELERDLERQAARHVEATVRYIGADGLVHAAQATIPVPDLREETRPRAGQDVP